MRGKSSVTRNDCKKMIVANLLLIGYCIYSGCSPKVYHGSRRFHKYFISFILLNNWHTQCTKNASQKEIKGAISSSQGHIHVANECPTYARNRSIVNQNLRFRVKLSWIEDKTVNFDGKQVNSRVKHVNSSIFEHPTVGSQKFNTLHVGW